VLNNALTAFHAGYSHSLGNVLRRSNCRKPAQGGHQVVMTAMKLWRME